MATVDQAGNPVTSADTPVRMLADFQLPPEAAGVPNATIGRAVAQLPPHVAPNFPSFGGSTQQCPVSSVVRPSASPGYQGYQWFDPISASTGANLCTNTTARLQNTKVGVATITTPLTEAPLIGNIYFIAASPIPLIGVWIDPSIAPTNPKGITAGIFAKTSTPSYVNNPDLGVALTLTMDSLPDLPITRLQLDIGNNTTRPLGAEILVMAAPTDPSCLPKPADDPLTPFDDSTTPAADSITRMRPWNTIGSDDGMQWTGATYNSLLDNPAPGDVELTNPFPITDCQMPE